MARWIIQRSTSCWNSHPSFLCARSNCKSGDHERLCFRVLAAFFAAFERDAADRLLAAAWACRDSAVFEAALCPSRFKAREVARERLADTFLLPLLPFRRSR